MDTLVGFCNVSENIKYNLYICTFLQVSSVRFGGNGFIKSIPDGRRGCGGRRFLSRGRASAHHLRLPSG
jgi:hypothetical protein